MPEYALDLEFLHGRRIHSILVYVDDPRLRIGWIEQRLTKESLGCRVIAFGREQEIIGLPGGIHGAIQIAVLPFDVGFIDTVAFIGALQVSAAALVEFRPVDSDPAPDATGVKARPRSSAISAMCAKEIRNLRYHRTHQRIISPG